MGKKRASWFCTILLGLSVLVTFIFFAMPKNDRDPVLALPRSLVKTAHVIFSGKGSVIPKGLVEDLCGSTGVVLRLASGSKEAAFILNLSEDEEFFSSFVFSGGVVRSLKNCEIPSSWANFLGKARVSLAGSPDFSYLQISGGFSHRPIYCTVQENLVLLASSPDGLQDMLKALRLELEPSRSLWSIEPYWDGHLRIDLREKYGESEGIWGVIGSGQLQCAWKKGRDDSGELSWKIDGIEELSSVCPPVEWGDMPELPSPLDAVLGISSIGTLRDHLPGIPRITAPVIFATGGSGDILSVPFPGIMMAELCPSEDSISKSLMDGPLSAYTLKPFSSDRYPSGLVASHPATITLGHSQNTSLSGIIDVNSLRFFDISELDRYLPPGWSKSLLWGYVNGSSFAQTLEGLVISGRLLYPEQDGVSSLPEMDSLIYLTRKMRKVGTLSFVMPNLAEGTLLWN